MKSHSLAEVRDNRVFSRWGDQNAQCLLSHLLTAEQDDYKPEHSQHLPR